MPQLWLVGFTDEVCQTDEIEKINPFHMKTAKLIKKGKSKKKIEKLKRIVGSGYRPMFTNYMRCNTDKNISLKLFSFGRVCSPQHIAIMRVREIFNF